MSKLDLFITTITSEVLEPADYVAWEKIERIVNNYRKEIALLQSLKYSENPHIDIAELLIESPCVLEVLQLLIANTPQEIYFTDGRFIRFKNDQVNLSSGDFDRAKELAFIFVEMGLIDFLRSVESVRDCARGVLIGLEPNARKNRRGKKFEDIVRVLIQDSLEELGGETGVDFRMVKNLKVDLSNEKKIVDFAVFVSEELEPRVIVEVNFYSVTGSKPSETLPRSYPEVQRELEDKGIGFIVVTDGKAWLKMRNSINTMLEKLGHCYNLKQAREGALKNALRKFLL